MTLSDSNELQLAKRILVISDFAGFTRAFDEHDDTTMAELINQFYTLALETITRHGGRVVKFMGDACLAVFDEEAGPAAVTAMLELQRAASSLTAAHGIELVLGARAHCGMVVEGLYGPPEHARYDVVGAAVNTTALMGGGSDIWISDTVYQQLDDDTRANWKSSERRATDRYVYTVVGGDHES